MLATEVPGAKQRTYAAFNPADMVMVNFSDMPLSMANAFEKAVKAKDGFCNRLYRLLINIGIALPMDMV